MKPALIFFLPAIVWAGAACGHAIDGNDAADSATVTAQQTADTIEADSLRVETFPVDFLPPGDEATRYTSLSEEDFRIVAEELGVEVAAIKAVVSIEAGSHMRGFAAPGVPIVNFDASMYKTYGPKAPDKKGDPNAKVPDGLSGSQLKKWTRLTNAMKQNAEGAMMGTFWGMFQIGGFHYKKCGCKDVREFVRVMSESEFSQLELFAKFITASGMLPDLKSKNWAGFARKYNGASYAKKGYHTKMANAYKKFKGKA